MADVVRLTAFEAFQKEIKALSLYDFPCGNGSWRDPCKTLKAKGTGSSKIKSLNKQKLDCSLNESDDPQKEKCEDLLEFANSPYSPWYQDYSWSNEAKSLKELAIKSPSLVNQDFVYKYFKTLKLVDKSITEVDDGLLRLENLEELTLSANYITSINFACLPHSLKVLELYGNHIQDISALGTNSPPMLQYLGLGMNKISSLGDSMSGTYWPKLLSLDLSYNDLCNLTGTVQKFSTLPKLKNVNLQGNPVSLAAPYRGYLIDSLPHLSFIDDLYITPDEKLHSKGFAKKKAIIHDEAIVQLGVAFISGLPCPPEIMYPDEQPELPILERTYFVQFMFPEELFGISEEGKKQKVDSLATLTSQNRVAESDVREAPVNPQWKSESYHQISQDKKESSEGGSPKKSDETVASILENGGTLENKNKIEEAETTSKARMIPVNSSFCAWREVLDMNWTTDLTISKILPLRNFFMSGMDVHVMEQLVEYNVIPEEDGKGKEQKGKKKDKDKKKEKEVEKEKDKDQLPKKKKVRMSKPTRKEPEKPKEKPNKKKYTENELVKGPPSFTTIASFHLPLECFVNGEHVYQETFTSILNRNMEEKQRDSKNAAKGKKKGKNVKEVEKPNTRKGQTLVEGEEEEISLLTVKLSVKLHSWLIELSPIVAKPSPRKKEVAKA